MILPQFKDLAYEYNPYPSIDNLVIDVPNLGVKDLKNALFGYFDFIAKWPKAYLALTSAAGKAGVTLAINYFKKADNYRSASFYLLYFGVAWLGAQTCDSLVKNIKNEKAAKTLSIAIPTTLFVGLNVLFNELADASNPYLSSLPSLTSVFYFNARSKKNINEKNE
jgi:hypothetical protein